MSEPRRRPGRPPLDPYDRSQSMTVTLPSKQLDALYLHAKTERMTVPELVRELLRILPDKKP